MAKSMTEDAVRDLAREALGLVDSEIARAGVGQLTTFNQLGFPGVADKPDGWYLPNGICRIIKMRLQLFWKRKQLVLLLDKRKLMKF